MFAKTIPFSVRRMTRETSSSVQNLGKYSTKKVENLIVFRTFSTKKSEKNIIRTTCQDVDIRPTTLSKFIWDNSTKLYPDKIALVNM